MRAVELNKQEVTTRNLVVVYHACLFGEKAKFWIPNFWNYGNKIDEKVEIIFYEDNEDETQTLNWIRAYVENNADDYIMYFHSSGINNLPVIIKL
jgi:hypothetical protein